MNHIILRGVSRLAVRVPFYSATHYKTALECRGINIQHLVHSYAIEYYMLCMI